jgi:hypothetical protein
MKISLKMTSLLLSIGKKCDDEGEENIEINF